MRLIDADKVRDDFISIVYEECAEDSDNNRANRIIDAFDNLPTVEAKPVEHGKWLTKRQREPQKIFCCSECKCTVELPHYAWNCYYDYCPNCGAKMDME